MTPFEAAILGLVEGLTEYLPISSTGHLILVSWLMGHADDDAIKSFEIVIQAGAILAVVGLYWQRMVAMVRGACGGDEAGRRLLINLVIAFLPAGVLGALLHKPIKSFLFGPWPVAAALVIGGVVMIALDRLRARRLTSGRELDALTPRGALLIGAAQCVAMWPGTSRALATILGGLGVGLTPAAAAEFSFLLALPTLGGAAVFDTARNGSEMVAGISPLAMAIGIVVAFISAAVAIKGFVAWLGSHGLVPFGVYRILLGLAVLFALS
ncbi:MAG: undecaprenyl-diphosphate phosphatase [Acidobacteria bacterium]|nr:undecaprenyl-diphosphate phosphatase [Acidobacteriota bacterium]